MTFTDHFDSHPMERPVCRYEYGGIARAVRNLRAECGDRLFVGHGIEVCYQPDQMGWILPFLEAHRFDLVILSVHWTQGRAMHMPEQWPDWDVHAASRAYLGTVLEAARFARDLARRERCPFDVLGHLDMVKRYTQRYRGSFDVTRYADLIDAILQTCLEAGLTPELNTSTLRQGLTEPCADWMCSGMPNWAAGHEPRQRRPPPGGLAANFDAAAALLRSNWHRQAAVFSGFACVANSRLRSGRIDPTAYAGTTVGAACGPEAGAAR